MLGLERKNACKKDDARGSKGGNAIPPISLYPVILASSNTGWTTENPSIKKSRRDLDVVDYLQTEYGGRLGWIIKFHAHIW